MAAFEHHFDIAQAAERIDSRTMEATEERLRDAFFTYDDELFTQFGVELPFDLVDDEDSDEDEDDFEDGFDVDLDDDDTEIEDIDAD